MNLYPRGSEWRIWDLHIHTPFTAKNNQYGSDVSVWENFIATLESHEDVAVLGITDYFSIDNYLFLNNKQKEGRLQGKTLIPNVELRLIPVTQNKKPINIHVLFDPKLDESVIEREFFRKLRFVYSGSTYSCIKSDLIDLGRKFKKNLKLEEDVARREGIGQFIVDYNDLKEIVKSPALKNNVIVAVANSSSDGASGIQGGALEATRQELYRMSDMIFSGKSIDTEYFLGKGRDSKEKVISDYGSLKPCITGSDAHEFSQINVFPEDRITWIKSDPTFEGLKQILYEPECRVRIQKNNPLYDIEKSSFTSIMIPNATRVFSDDEDTQFAPLTLPFNSGLVSIIGGRGTGKSVLINYIAAAFNKYKNRETFNLDSDIEISRKASVQESEKHFKVSEHPNVPFMYISQSQIKDLVQDKDEFSKNIRETIGVTDEYQVSSVLASQIESVTNEYYRINNILNSGGTDINEKKRSICSNIKIYSEFIDNITSEQNKVKLQSYKGKVEKYNHIKSSIEYFDRIVADIKKFILDKNDIFSKWNLEFKDFPLSIPLLNVDETVNYISSDFIPKLNDKLSNILEDINNTRNEFKDYKGDLSTLLSNISYYQNKLSEFKDKFKQINIEEQKYINLQNNVFKSLGKDICKSITEYKELIEQKWNEFRGLTSNVETNKKELLDIILKNDLNVVVSISFDAKKMYDMLLDKLDKRTYTEEKLRNLLGINTIEDYYSFVTQESLQNIFNSNVSNSLRGMLIDLLYKNYTLFVTHDINVTLANKPINKLSYGQQGTVYLRLQIAANIFSETIIYDQPEDDLDNSFITKELIAIFKTIKQYRQIIIVSHNANLVVNSDSEQIIIAHNNDGVLSYTSGSLENSEINKAVCDILEGGKLAFEKREMKYHVN